MQTFDHSNQTLDHEIKLRNYLVSSGDFDFLEFLAKEKEGIYTPEYYYQDTTKHSMKTLKTVT